MSYKLLVICISGFVCYKKSCIYEIVYDNTVIPRGDYCGHFAFCDSIAIVKLLLLIMYCTNS